MNDIITIKNNKLPVREYKGQRVFTLKDIDILHQRTEGTARRNFNTNKKRFKEDKDFFRVSKEEIQLSELQIVENISNKGTILITETGYLLLIKSFTDDLAWEMQRSVHSGKLQSETLEEKSDMNGNENKTNEVMNVHGTNLMVKEYKGHRVVTFKDVDAVHQRPEGTARKRFNDNKKHFVSGVDFFKISPSEYRTALGYMDSRQQNNITLITETGYLMLVKSFTDDLAWDVQRSLVKTYFQKKNETIVNTSVVAPINTSVFKYPPTEENYEIMLNCAKQINKKREKLGIQSCYTTSEFTGVYQGTLKKQKKWSTKNCKKMNDICLLYNITPDKLFSYITNRLERDYDLDNAEEIYEQAMGIPPEHPLDIINYFPELAELADSYIEKIIEYTNTQLDHQQSN